MRMRLVAGWLVLSLLALVPPALAAARVLPVGAGAPRLTVLAVGDDQLRLHVEVGRLEAQAVATPQGDFTRLVIPGFHATREVGAPELPLMNRLLAVPYGAAVRVEVENAVRRDIDLQSLGLAAPLLPAQPSLAKDADPQSASFALDRSAYLASRIGGPVARAVPCGRLRAVDVCRLEFSPVTWYPQGERLEVIESADLRIVYEHADPDAGRDLRARTASPFFAHLYTGLAGAAALDAEPDGLAATTEDTGTGPAGLAVVTPPEFVPVLEDFLAWKTARGFHVELGVVGDPEVGSTAAAIQDWVHGLYLNATPEQPAPSFLLLVGDVEQVPTFLVDGNATDRPYAAADGDRLPDLYYGRLSAGNATQLQAILAKTLAYDQLALPDVDYLAETCLVAGMDSYWAPTRANGQINYAAGEYCNAEHGLVAHTFLYPESGYQAAQIVEEVSKGVALINYTAHGSAVSWSFPAFTQGDVAGLGNAGKYCLAIANCCLSSSYQLDECFGETWLRAPQRGAVGYIGGSNSTYWNEDFWWAVGACAAEDISAFPTYEATGAGAYDGLFHSHGETPAAWYVTNDALVFAGNLAVLEAGSNLTDYYWDVYNLLGDPTLSTYLGPPSTNPVSHPATVMTLQTSLTLGAAPGSYVGLTQAGQLVGAGAVAAGGSATIALRQPLDPAQPLHVVVTAQNRWPYVAELPVVVPATVSFDPAAIAAGTPAEVTVTVLTTGGGPQSGVEVWAAGLGYASQVATTDETGAARLELDYPYGPELEVVGREPGAEFDLFHEALAVAALPLSEVDLSVTTGVGLADTFAVGLPGTLRAVGTAAEAVLWALLPDGSRISDAVAALDLLPEQRGLLTGCIAVPGHDLYRESFPVIEARGRVGGQVAAEGVPLGGVTVQGYGGLPEPAFAVVSAADGAFSVADEIPVGIYRLVAEAYGYQRQEITILVRHGSNSYDMTLDRAPLVTLTGTVGEQGTGTALAATVRLLRADTGEIVAETATDPTSGSFTTPAVPAFAYVVTARAWRHLPVRLEVNLGEPLVEKHLRLEPASGELLLLDDGPVLAARPGKPAQKEGAPAAAGYLAPAAKDASALAADLQALGFGVTVVPATDSEPAAWDDYDLLILGSGDNANPVADGVLRGALEEYAGRGGRLLLEGGELGYAALVQPGYPRFAARVLHAAGWERDDCGSLTVAEPAHPVMSEPQTVPGSLLLDYSGYADQDAMRPTADAAAPGSWSEASALASVLAYDPNPAPEGGQIVYLACRYAALESPARLALLADMLRWLLTPEIGSCAIAGRVTLHGRSHHDGVVVQSSPGGRTATTGPDGSYVLRGLFPGTHQVTARKDGWSVERVEVSVSEGENKGAVDFLLLPVQEAEACRAPAIPVPDGDAEGIHDQLRLDAEGKLSAVAVQLDLHHTFVGDLVVELTSPAGTTVKLHERAGGSADDLVGWYPDEREPVASLETFLGEEASGRWTLTVRDLASVDTGVLEGWCLRVLYAEPVSVPPDGPPQRLALGAAWPNPFNPSTHIDFDLPGPARVELAVFDLGGRRVATLASELLPAGRHQRTWEGRDGQGRPVASGLYVLRLRAEGRTLARKALLLK